MPRKPAKQSGVKTGVLDAPLTVPALKVTQGESVFYVFLMRASVLWPMVSINRRAETEDRGYQRVLSNARVEAVANHIRSGKPLPNSVLISLDNAKYDEKARTLTIPKGKDIGWVIDGQHRIAGAHEAAKDVDIELCVFAFVKIDLDFQIEQFVTINREQKGVPTSLVYDLLSHLPSRKRPLDVANERAAEIANELRQDSKSALFNRIVVTQSPVRGQISITNFVRKVSPHVHPERGVLRVYTLPEQVGVLGNYFNAIKGTFPEEWSKSDNVLLRTVGFGAMMNVFEEVFTIVLTEQHGFTIDDVEKNLRVVKHFDFRQWASYGTGNKAETEAAQEFRTDFNRARAAAPTGKGIRLV